MLEFIVIGGGIAGLSAAAALSELGRVHLVEAEDALATQTSARSAALYEVGYGAAGFAALIDASQAWFEAAEVLSPRGLLLVGTPQSAEAFASDLASSRLEPVSMGEARAMWPILGPTVDRAAVNRAAFDIDTHGMIEWFRKAARANGATFQTRARVTRIARLSTSWRVTAGGEVLEARRLVNAAGAWADQIAGLAGITPLGIQPYRRSMARLPVAKGLDIAGWPMVVGAGEDWYCKPDAGALLVSPADEDPMAAHDAWPEDLVLAEGLARFAEHADFEIKRPLARWAGLRSFAQDRELVLGPSHEDGDFIWCAGQGGAGFQSAPAASALLADLVAGRAVALPRGPAARLAAARFAG